jgi:serine/threonine-protein kinase RsbW
MTDDFLRRTSRDEEHFDLLKRLGFMSYMTVPLFGDTRILGSITLVSAGSGRRFSPDDVELAQEFAARVAQVVAQAHRYDSARRSAHTLQASLLPDHVPDVEGIQIAVRYLPATIDSDVGGDFYDVFFGDHSQPIFAIGDVAGHDVTAAAIMGKLRSAVRVLAAQAPTPTAIIEMLYKGWDYLDADRIATLLIASCHTSTGEIEIASAGHPPPLLVSAGEVQLLDVRPSAPLGAPYGEVHRWRGDLPQNSALVLFTDGLIERSDRGFDEGMEKLLAVAGDVAEPKDLCDRIIEAFVLDEVRRDDVAMMVIWRVPA